MCVCGAEGRCSAAALAQPPPRAYTPPRRQAIGFDPNNHVLYSNRSAAYLALERAEEALEDASMCIELNSSWGKGYGRKASALIALKRYADAIKVYRTGAIRRGRHRRCRPCYSLSGPP